MTVLAIAALLLLASSERWGTGAVQQVRPQRQSPFAPLKELRPWSGEELQQLAALRREGAYDWATIAQKVGRSSGACSQKYASLCGDSARTLTSSEQKQILRLTVLHGENWRLISLAMRARRAAQGGQSEEKFSEEHLKYFYRRYTRGFVSGPWTADETGLLRRLVLENLRNPVQLDIERAVDERSAAAEEEEEEEPRAELAAPADGSLESLKALMRKGADDEELLAFIKAVRSSDDGEAPSPSSAAAGGGDSDVFRVHAQRSPPSWRNVSHILMRSSADCRQAYLSSVLRKDLSQQRDVWYPGEVYFLQQLAEHWNRSWVAIGNELGRSPQQCRNAHAAGSGSAVLRVRGESRSSDCSFVRAGRCSRSWTAAEDVELVRLRGEHSDCWAPVAAAMQRTNAQCFQRYSILAARAAGSAQHGWSEAQNRELSALVRSEGAQWSAIGRRLGRTAYVCRAAYKRLLDRARGSGAALAPMPRHHAHRQRDAQLLAAAGEGRAWTREEDAYLKSLVDSAGRRWSSIAEEMHRSPEDIMLRFDFKIAPRRMGQWSREEDRQLLQLHSSLGPRWAKVPRPLTLTLTPALTLPCASRSASSSAARARSALCASALRWTRG